MKTWVFDRTDFEGNPHYNFHFNDLCEYLGLTNDRKAEDIDSITVKIELADYDLGRFYILDD